MARAKERNGGLLSTARGIEHSRLNQSCKDWMHEKEKVNKHTKREGVDYMGAKWFV